MPAGRRAEEVDVLPGHAEVDDVGEEPGEPGAAGPDDAVGLEPLAVDEHRLALGCGRARHEARAALDCLLRDHPRRVARAQDPGLGLVQDRVEIPAVEAGKEAGSFVGSEPLDRDALLAEDALALGAPAVALAEEPGDAARHEELGARVAFQLAPELERAPGRAGVPGVGAVRAADQPRLAAGSGADVAGRVLLDESDLPAARDEPECERAAEDAGADDDRATQSSTLCARPSSMRHAASSRVSVRRISHGREAQSPARSRSVREGRGADVGWE